MINLIFILALSFMPVDFASSSSSELIVSDKKVRECTMRRKKDGSIVGYGNTCTSGTSSCVANPCFDGNLPPE